jgi:hypothetical protein
LPVSQTAYSDAAPLKIYRDRLYLLPLILRVTRIILRLLKISLNAFEKIFNSSLSSGSIILLLPVPRN